MSVEKEFYTIVEKIYDNKRVDKVIAENAKISRAIVRRFAKNIFVNMKNVKPSYKVKAGDTIEFKYIETIEANDIKPQNIPLDIVYEDEHIIVVNKPYGMVTHPAKGNWENTLLNAVFWKLKDKDSKRPGIVHRLDKDTSGLIVVAKTKRAQELLAKAFKKRKVDKIYYALVEGHMTNQKGVIDLPIGRDRKNRLRFKVSEYGKRAITLYKVLKEYKDVSLVALKIKTGRTHQIRVHLSHIGNPVVGDKIYGKRFKNLNMCLVAKRLGFYHPITKKYLSFSVKVPRHMMSVIKRFKDK